MTIDSALPETRNAAASGERARRGGRSANARRGGAAVSQMPWGVPENPDKPTEPLPMEGVLAIHSAAMTILEDIGIEFLNLEAIAVLEAFVPDGVIIENRHAEGARIRMDREFVIHYHTAQP
jgi:trimethylamine---corrinoid protein Co-methyltransferase